jgi:CRP-like cAMP-binding protein
MGLPQNDLIVMRSGEALLTTSVGYEEPLAAGSHFGGSALLNHANHAAQVRFLQPTEAYQVPLDSILEVPVVRWKMLETHRRRYQD